MATDTRHLTLGAQTPSLAYATAVAAFLSVFFIFCAAFALVSFPLQAQQPLGCTYDECALRVVPGGFFSGPTVVRGQSQEFVARLGRSDALGNLFASQDSARAHYEVFLGAHRRSRLFLWTGMGLFAVGSLMARDSQGSREWTGLGLQIGGFISAALGGMTSIAAQRSMAGAIWWYNRQLDPPL